MTNNIRIRPRARQDIVEVAVFIGRDSLTAAERFLDATETTFQLLVASPEIGPIYPTKQEVLTGLRVFRVNRFPNHLVFYRVLANGIEIIRVIHGARDLELALLDEEERR
jgi:toxin ParE1/3/4